MKYALVNDENVVVNIVESIDGSDVLSIDDLTAMQVQDWVNIGDTIDKPEQEPIPQPTAEELKQMRNDALFQDMTLRACWSIEKKSRPSLTFSDYLDELEQLSPTS